MNSSRLFLTFITFFCFWHANCQTQEEFDAFAQEVLDEAKLFYNLVKATELTNTSGGSERLSYKLSNGEIKTIGWLPEAPNVLALSNFYNSELELLNAVIDPKEPNPSEKILISAYTKTMEIIKSGDLDLQRRKTILKPIFIFQNQNQNPDIEHSNTELIVFLLRDDADDAVVPMGGDFYLEFDGIGGLNDIYTIDQDYFFPEGSKIVEGSEVTGVIHGHSRTEDPIISSTEICSVMLHAEIITWDTLTVMRTYTDSTYTEVIYTIKDQTLIVKERKEPLYNLPKWSVIVECGNLSYQMFIDSYDEIDEKIFRRTEESWRKTMLVYKPHEALGNWPNIEVGRLGLIKIIFKNSKCDLFPEDLKALFK